MSKPAVGRHFLAFVMHFKQACIRFSVDDTEPMSLNSSSPKSHSSLAESPLGKASDYVATYTPSLLHSIPRAEARAELRGFDEKRPFHGEDVWNCYELSWLSPKGGPRGALLRIQVPQTSAAIVESKSMKLYLNSFAQTRFASTAEVQKTLDSDLMLAFRSPVMIELTEPEQLSQAPNGLPGECLDDIDVEVEKFTVDDALLGSGEPDTHVHKTMHSHLFRSLCPVTGQPDWASLLIEYAGPRFETANLYRYLVSYREHPGFHEATIEQIYLDIQNRLEPTSLTVYGRFLRRGGVDINPFRASNPGPAPEIRVARQ